MKIIINGKFLCQNVSGVQRYAIEISRRLKEANPEILVLAPANILQQDVARELNVVVIGKFKGHLWEQISLPLFLRQRYRSGGYLLLNFTNTAPVLVKSNIVTLHDITFIKFSSSYSLLFSAYYRFIIPLIIRRAKLLFTVSETVKRELINHFKVNKSRIHVTYNAINTDVFNCFETENAEVSSILEQNNVDRFVLAVSMFNPIKNLEGLISAYESSGLVGIKLVIVGDYYKSFKKSKRLEGFMRSPDIISLGRINDPRAISFLYKKATVFAFPSFYESFGIPPLESMACGCPTIVSKAGALPETCGDAAYYIDPNDTRSISQALVRVLSDSDLRENLIDKGKERVKVFEWSTSANVIVNALSNVS